MRQSGLLVHITSLSGPEGIGTLGGPSRELIDFLSASGTRIWQMLPVGPVGYGSSPYQSPSTFAGNPLLIDLEALVEMGLLRRDELPLSSPSAQVDFERVESLKKSALEKAFERAGSSLDRELEAFSQSAPWVTPYAQYQALTERFGWFYEWPVNARRYYMDRNRETERLLSEFQTRVRYHCFLQYLFDLQWKQLKDYARQKDILLFGDIPIYVAPGSADVWQHPKLFQVDRDLNPQRVAGVPPDYFSADGQLWGNPLYRWTALWATGYQWWIDRLSGIHDRFDIIRIDHFIGFANYYSIAARETTAKNGKWVKNQGKLFFRQVKRSLPGLDVVAEDLGEVNARVRSLLNACGYPGMKVLVFGLDGDESNPHHPANIHNNCVAYTGTHDNDTVLGWWNRIDGLARQNALRILKLREGDDICDGMIRTVLASDAERAVIPIQDYLALDNSARMNYPGTVGGSNWRYRMQPGDLSDAPLKRMQLLNREYRRNITS